MSPIKRLNLALILLIFLSCSCTAPVDPEIEKEIRDLETEIYYISTIRTGFGHFFVHIRYNSEPSELQPDSAGMKVCTQVVEILKKHSIKKRAAVTVESPEKKDGRYVRPYIYGFMRYKKSKAKYEWTQVRDN